MPPLCTPAPFYLRTERPERPAMAAPREETEERAQTVAALVTALTRAAADDDRDDPERQSRLAARGYSSLCFDFPIVSTDALTAVAAAFRSTSSSNAPSAFPITERFVSGLRYLASKEFKEPGVSDVPPVGEDVTTENGGESGTDSNVRRNHLIELCGCVFLLAPASRLGVANEDDGVSLQDFLANFDPNPADLLEQEDITDDSRSDPCNGHQSVEAQSNVNDEIAAEMDDDDTDWEALETFSVPSEEIVSDERCATSGTGDGALSNLMCRVAVLVGFVPFEVINDGLWDQLQLTHHLIQALKSLKMLERKHPEVDGCTVAKLYTELLADHVLVNWSTSSTEVSRFVSALMGLVDTTEEIKQRKSRTARATAPAKNWNELILSALARTCSNAGGCPPSKLSSSKAYAETSKDSTTRSRKHSSLPSASFVRYLWRSVSSNMNFFRSQLIESVKGSESFGRVEMVLWILCFVVKCSPGNVDLRAMLLEGEIFRAALQLFAKVGHEANMESLRHFLLLSMATSPPLAEFAAQVPFFIAAIPATRDPVEGSCMEAHAVVWPLILRAACDQSRTGHSSELKPNDAERVIVDAFETVVDSVADDTIKTSPYSFQRSLLWVHRLLVVLEEATSASSSLAFKLWGRRSPLDISIGRCLAVLGSVHASWTHSDSGNQKACLQKPQDCRDPSPPSDGGSADRVSCSAEESKKKDCPHLSFLETEIIAVQKKLQELLPSMLLRLKRLSLLTRENREAKID